MTRNEILYQQHVEQGRANRAAEAENVRSHVAQETETNRSNRVREIETERSNRAREQETERSNREREASTWTSLQETRRANTAREQQQRNELSESVRSHKANESVAWSNLSEQRRSNRVNEALKRQDIINRDEQEYSKLQETKRANEAKETELNRANVASEEIRKDANRINEIASMMNAVVSENRTLDELTVRQAIADLDRSSRETIAEAMNEVTKRGQNMQLIDRALGIIADLVKSMNLDWRAIRNEFSLWRYRHEQ